MEAKRISNPLLAQCSHDHRCRYTHGFLCEDCHEFFQKGSPTYRSDEMMSDLWMALHNVNACLLQGGKPAIQEVYDMRDKIGIGLYHSNYEELIAEAEAVLARYGSHCDAATLVIGRK